MERVVVDVTLMVVNVHRAVHSTVRLLRFKCLEHYDHLFLEGFTIQPRLSRLSDMFLETGLQR